MDSRAASSPAERWLLCWPTSSLRPSISRSPRWPAGRIASLLVLIAALPCSADQKLTTEERVELVRGLMAEYATVKKPLPRSKKPLPFESTGKYDEKQWEAIGKEMGPAARLGDLIQITRVTLDDDKIVLEINGGIRSGRHWYDRIEMSGGVSGRSAPLGQSGTPTAGTYIAVLFHKPLSSLKSADVKKMLAPVLDFEKRTATESYVETLPPEVKQAIKDKKAREGMDREQVLLALGRPERKSRETKDGLEVEDWIYGTPPGRITFVTFNGNKVIKVKESYAGLGGEAAAPLPVR